ncbi:hypothetical protein EZV62_018558 [Acer yangbiense]|uniref:RNase H type-1 domain-containing protein n=1 Tax=Acer yangbiense TaxID=1000413 RepID=A0A5C7HKG9_9ROSI|nr:hypothetical protein EZV62_018558 [Acer yangbiense]
MEEMSVKFPDCEDIISSSWKESSRAIELSDVQKKINTCAVNLSKWSRHKFGDLCLPSGDWNYALVHNSFLPDDAALILNLPRLSPNRDDTLCWHFDRKGFYSVRSGYKVAIGLKERAGSASPQLSSWWRFLWKCNVPNKCKIFFWKAFHGWLPTFATLARRRVDVLDHCLFCGAANESITHVLWSCQLAVDVWRMLLGEESNRNCVVHGAVGWNAADLVAWVDNFASDFRVANEPNHKEIFSHQPTWKPPKLGEFKINCDTSFRLRSGTAGVGVIIRNYKGTTIAAKSSPVLGCNSIEMLEAHACLVGLQLAIDVGISGVVLESDAEGVVRLLSNHIVPRTEIGAIIRRSLDLGASVHLLSVDAVRRGANSVAHNLAQLAHSLDGPMVWLDSLPPDIARLVSLDSSAFACSV